MLIFVSEPSIIQQFQITNSNGIHIGPNYNVNIDKSATTTKSPNAPKETKTIRGMHFFLPMGEVNLAKI